MTACDRVAELRAPAAGRTSIQLTADNTTYRLVRHVTDDGRKEVIVSGRRAAGAAPPPSESG